MKPDILKTMQLEDHLARALNIVQTIFNHSGAKWFLSFGTLLHFIRDRNMGVKFDQDIDVSVLGDCDCDRIVDFMGQWSYELRRKCSIVQSNYG